MRDGTIPRTRETWLGERFTGHVTGFPSVDVRTTGAGGGSIARVDSGGLLTVGPQSAGSVPGPVCYSRGGTEVTVTDACMVLGYLDPARLVELGVDVDIEAARRAVRERIGDPLGLTMEIAAEAVLRVATETMVHAVEEVTVEQGIDPRGPASSPAAVPPASTSSSIAQRLGCAQVVIPQTSTALSASGGLVSDIVAEHGVALFTSTEQFAAEAVNAALVQLLARCKASLRNAGLSTEDAQLSRCSPRHATQGRHGRSRSARRSPASPVTAISSASPRRSTHCTSRSSPCATPTRRSRSSDGGRVREPRQDPRASCGSTRGSSRRSRASAPCTCPAPAGRPSR